MSVRSKRPHIAGSGCALDKRGCYDEILAGFSIWRKLHRESRLSRCFSPPHSVYGVLPLSDVKAGRLQQACCCIVGSRPLIQLISSRAEADRSLLIIVACCGSTPVPEWLDFASPPPVRHGEESLRILPSLVREPQAAPLQEAQPRRSEHTATGNW